jgi:hypothetical protein
MRPFRLPVIALLFFACRLLYAQPTDLAAVRLLAQKLHDAYSAKDAEAIIALFSQQSPQRTQLGDAAQKLLAGISS